MADITIGEDEIEEVVSGLHDACFNPLTIDRIERILREHVPPPEGEEDLLPRDQRLAAMLILAAVDLPCEAAPYARQMIEAARVLPGATVGGDLKGMGDRVGLLKRAREVLDGLIAVEGERAAEARIS